MHLINVECCARILRRVATLGLALFALDLVESSTCDATSLSHGSYVVDIRVIESAGPIRVDSQYTGVAGNGLPTVEIYEKFRQRGDARRYWADVELKVKVRAPHSGDGHDDGSIFDGIHGIFDDILDLFSHDNQTDESWIGGESDPNVWDKEVVIGIDKFVKNRTEVDWRSFRIELGTGVGDSFVPSHGADGLYIVSDPMAKETTSFYVDPPARDFPGSDYLHWSTNGQDHPGQGYDDRAGFWFGVNIPPQMFEVDPYHDGYWRARFTLRQHTGVPEPTTAMLLLVGATTGLLRRGKRNDVCANRRASHLWARRGAGHRQCNH